MPTCADCTYYDDYFRPKWCYVTLNFQEPNEFCNEWLGKDERVDMWTGEKFGPLNKPSGNCFLCSDPASWRDQLYRWVCPSCKRMMDSPGD